MSVDATGRRANEGDLEAVKELIADLLGTASTLHLYNTPFTPTANSVYADFVAAEPTDAWYAPIALVFGTPGFNGAGVAAALSHLAQWTTASPVTSQTVKGLWISVAVAGPANRVYTYFPLTTAITLSTVGQIIAAVYEMTLANWPGTVTVQP